MSPLIKEFLCLELVIQKKEEEEEEFFSFLGYSNLPKPK